MVWGSLWGNRWGISHLLLWVCMLMGRDECGGGQAGRVPPMEAWDLGVLLGGPRPQNLHQGPQEQGWQPSRIRRALWSRVSFLLPTAWEQECRGMLKKTSGP